MEGIVDRFRGAGRAIFGPTAVAAQLEGSKIFAKNFFVQRSIPTAEFVAVDNRNGRTARGWHDSGFPVVLKADGLMAGKGVVIAQEPGEADDAIATLRGRLVVEEFLDWRRSELHRRVRRQERHAAGADPRPQSCLRRRQGAEHGRNGRILRR